MQLKPFARLAAVIITYSTAREMKLIRSSDSLEAENARTG